MLLLGELYDLGITVNAGGFAEFRRQISSDITVVTANIQHGLASELSHVALENTNDHVCLRFPGPLIVFEGGAYGQVLVRRALGHVAEGRPPLVSRYYIGPRQRVLKDRANGILEHRTRWSDARAVCLGPLGDFRL